MQALQGLFQGLVVLIEGFRLFGERAFGVPVFEATPVQVVEGADAFDPLKRPRFKLGKISMMLELGSMCRRTRWFCVALEGGSELVCSAVAGVTDSIKPAAMAMDVMLAPLMLFSPLEVLGEVVLLLVRRLSSGPRYASQCCSSSGGGATLLHSS